MKDDVKKMRKNFKLALLTFMLLATVFFAAACSSEPTPYDNNDADGYNVSVKFDANGGFFATSTSVIVDSYNISDLKPDSNGMVQIGLLAPDDSQRGSSDTFTATKNGYFLYGWYTERNESTDSEGNTVYTYANKWDFKSDVLDVDPSKSYTASEPVLTLYAAWVPMFEINFVTLGTDEVVGTYTYNPEATKEIRVPEWNMETGAMDMFRFPKKSGYTFNGAYYDAEGTESIEGTVIHPSEVDEKTGTVDQHSMTVYVDWLKGDWYRISTVKQLKSNALPNGNYILEADLDFEGEDWPKIFTTSNFTGTIQGNGHVIKNVSIVQDQARITRFGLFGTLKSGSKLENVTFENVTMTIKAGFTGGEIFCGLLAGSIESDAVVSGIEIKGSAMQFDSSMFLTANDVGLGLICGDGDSGVVENADITVSAVGSNPEKLTITVSEDDGNTITLVIA